MGLVQHASRWIAQAASYPCPCCGHLVFDEAPGSYVICPLCFWEDDAVQLRWPTYAGGANRPSLIDSQRATSELGAMEFRFTGIVRGAAPDEPIDPLWRPIDPTVDSIEDPTGPRRPWPEDPTTLYWWRPGYWLG
ncbi:MAG: hypothetical protein KF906_09775 [Actinobacteria bacterium]|nr:hypothetical protein [Actinomycetota bacterium]